MKDFYLSDEYIKKNPTLHEEDSPWKVEKILPLVDIFLEKNTKKEINILDVGGGAGLILKAVADYIRKKGIRVNKFALDLSPGMLKSQKKNNPDLKKALNEDIKKTTFKEKEIDLVLMIDILEHVPDPEEALKELKRISAFVVFKVPLEDNLLLKSWNLVKRGEPRRRNIQTIGHINVYNFSKLRKHIERNAGNIEKHYFTNSFEYFSRKNRKTIINRLGSLTFRVSPRLCSLIFNDFAVLLVRCY